VKYRLIIAIVLALASPVCAQAPSAQAPANPFERDPKVQEMAEAYSLGMIEVAKRHLNIDLDGSDQSIQQLERIAQQFHTDYVTGKTRPSEETIAPFYRMLGSYVGEVYRRNHGAEWGWINLEGNRFTGMQRDPELFRPWGKARKRIVNGPEDSLAAYYQYLTGLK